MPTRLRISFAGIDHLEHELAEHAAPDDLAGAGVLDLAHRAAELVVRELAARHEVQLGHQHVAAGEAVDQPAEERDLRAVELVLTALQVADDLALA